MFARTVEKAMMTDAIPSVTHKLSIGYGDMYVKLGWVDGRPVHLDVTISSINMDKNVLGSWSAGFKKDIAEQSGCDDEILRKKAQLTDLNNQLIRTARASMEVSCKMASSLLKSGVWTLDHLISSWSGTKFEPSGACRQLSRIVSSPMDAVASLCAQRKDAWEKEFRSAKV